MGLKEYMHELAYIEMSADVNIADLPPTFFASGIPVVRVAPAFELKNMDDATVRNITPPCIRSVS